jgi:hypothetical protein
MIGKQSTRHAIYEEIYTVLAASHSENLVEEKLRVQLTARLGWLIVADLLSNS